MASPSDRSHELMCDLLALASAGARGEQKYITINDWGEILCLAHEHNVLSLLACALMQSPNLSCPENIREYVLNSLRYSASANTVRRQRVFSLLRELKLAGFDVKLLKGYSVACYYAFPDSRDSVDTDILICEEQEKAIYSFLEAKGFQVEERSLTSHHGVCLHRKYGKIEIHTSLYDEIIEDVWFKGMGSNEFIQDSFEKMSIEDGEFVTLSATDQQIFLTLHMIKHFIDGGLSIRMMIDVVLHYVKRQEDIDLERYWGIIEELHYTNLVYTVLRIMRQYAGFIECASLGIELTDQAHVELLLDDLVTGGYMGVKEQAIRLESGMEYNRQLFLKSKSSLQYKLYMLWWKVRSGFRFMFSSPKYLRKKYSCLEKLPMLFPFIWVYQMIVFPMNKIKSGVLKRDIRCNEHGTSDRLKKRIDMFKKLGML